MAQNIHLEATLRQPEWQTRVARVSTKAIIKGALAMQKANERNALRNNTNPSTVANRKNADQVHPTIKSKKISPKKFKLGFDSECTGSTFRPLPIIIFIIPETKFKFVNIINFRNKVTQQNQQQQQHHNPNRTQTKGKKSKSCTHSG